MKCTQCQCRTNPKYRITLHWIGEGQSRLALEEHALSLLQEAQKRFIDGR